MGDGSDKRRGWEAGELFWNAHDLDLIMSHYEDAVELTSPVAARLPGTSDGRVIGKGKLESLLSARARSLPEAPSGVADRGVATRRCSSKLHHSILARSWRGHPPVSPSPGRLVAVHLPAYTHKDLHFPGGRWR
jgi:hypothetical protein